MTELSYSLKYRLYPSEGQEEELEKHLELHRQVYKYFLERLNEERSLGSGYREMETLPDLKQEWEDLQTLHSKALQKTVQRLYDNLKTLKAQKGNGRKVGKLRFKGKGWFKSFKYSQSGFGIRERKDSFRLDHLSKIGEVPIRLHRPVTGEVKEVVVKRHQSGKWYAILAVDENFDPKPVQGEKKAVGIDLGTLNYAVDSDGRSIGNPRNVEKAEERLAKAQQDLHRKQKGSKNREKARRRVAKLHEEVRNRRRDFLHKLAAAYVENYDIIVVEDLDVAEMVKDSKYAKNNLDASWGTLVDFLTYKAEKAGTETKVVKIDPENTTKNCAECGTEVPKPLWQRKHTCPECGWTCDRDYNAAHNILNRGLKKLGKGQAEDTPTDTEPLQGPELRLVPASSVVELGSSVLTETRQESKVKAG